MVAAGVDVGVALVLHHGGGLAPARAEAGEGGAEGLGEFLRERRGIGLRDGDAQAVVLARGDQRAGARSADDGDRLIGGGATAGDHPPVRGHRDRAGGDPAGALGAAFPQGHVHGPVGAALGAVRAHAVQRVDHPHAVRLEAVARVRVPFAEDEVVGAGHREPVQDHGAGLPLGEVAEFLRSDTGHPQVGEQPSGLCGQVLGESLVVGPSVLGEGAHAGDSRGPRPPRAPPGSRGVGRAVELCRGPA